MANSNGWGDGAANNAIGWGQGANNNIGWGSSHATSWAGATDIVGIDADAQAFITAAAITDATQQTAIDDLVTGLKTDGIWTKMKAIYPFVGGTATTHKWNLKDPRDLDAAFRLVFNGGWTHSSTGATPNGTNGYADTKLNSFTNLTQTSISFGIYYRSNAIALPAEGSYNGDSLSISARGNTTYFSAGTYAQVQILSDSSLGLKTVCRNGSNVKAYLNATQNGSATNSVNCPSLNMYLGALNNNGASGFYSSNQESFSFIGDGLSDSEMTNLYSKIQAFQTSLSRQV